VAETAHKEETDGPEWSSWQKRQKPRRGFKGGVTGVRPPKPAAIIGYEGAVPH